MSTTVFHCILCPTEADGHYPEFATPDAISDHLVTVHQAPKLYLMKEQQRLFGDHATITQYTIEDADGRIVGHGQTVVKRGAQ
jgi:hypothetical protein